MNERLIVTPLGPHIGALVENINIAHPLGDSQFEQLYHVLLKHQVLFSVINRSHRYSSETWPGALVICIFTRFIRIPKSVKKLSFWIPPTITHRIMTTGTLTSRLSKRRH